MIIVVIVCVPPDFILFFLYIISHLCLKRKKKHKTNRNCCLDYIHTTGHLYFISDILQPHTNIHIWSSIMAFRQRLSAPDSFQGSRQLGGFLVYFKKVMNKHKTYTDTNLRQTSLVSAVTYFFKIKNGPGLRCKSVKSKQPAH